LRWCRKSSHGIDGNGRDGVEAHEFEWPPSARSPVICRGSRVPDLRHRADLFPGQGWDRRRSSRATKPENGKPVISFEDKNRTDNVPAVIVDLGDTDVHSGRLQACRT